MGKGSKGKGGRGLGRDAEGRREVGGGGRKEGRERVRENDENRRGKERQGETGGKTVKGGGRGV